MIIKDLRMNLGIIENRVIGGVPAIRQKRCKNQSCSKVSFRYIDCTPVAGSTRALVALGSHIGKNIGNRVGAKQAN